MNYVNRNYNIKMEFTMSGEVPRRFTSEQLKEHIEGLLGEVEISSELFDGEKEDYIWTLFPDEYETFDVNEFGYRFIESPSCEHCGDNHTDFGIEIYDCESGVNWCINCGSGYFSTELIKTILKKEKKERKKFLKAKIESIKQELKEM